MKDDEIYREIIDLQNQKNKIELKIKDLKNELDSMIETERNPENKMIFIPDYVTNIKEYLMSRFPTYDFVSFNEDTRVADIVEKDIYVPKKKEFEDGGQVYRRVSKGKPSIDLDELQKGYPDIFSDIVMMVPEINETKVNEFLDSDPEFLDILQSVIKMESPSVAIVVSKSKKVKE